MFSETNFDGLSSIGIWDFLGEKVQVQIPAIQYSLEAFYFGAKVFSEKLPHAYTGSMNTKIPHILALPVLACVFLSGCVSDANIPQIPQYNMPHYERTLSPSYPAYMLASTPAGAYVLLNGVLAGTTPAASLYARRGDSIAVYKPGYDAAVFQAGEDGHLNANIPLFRSNVRYYSLLASSGAKFIQSAAGIVLESTGAQAKTNSSFVIYDGQYGTDVRLTVLEATPIFIRFRTSDGTEFCYPVGECGQADSMSDARIGQSSASSNSGNIALPYTSAQSPYIQSGINCRTNPVNSSLR